MFVASDAHAHVSDNMSVGGYGSYGSYGADREVDFSVCISPNLSCPGNERFSNIAYSDTASVPQENHETACPCSVVPDRFPAYRIEAAAAACAMGEPLACHNISGDANFVKYADLDEQWTTRFEWAASGIPSGTACVPDALDEGGHACSFPNGSDLLDSMRLTPICQLVARHNNGTRVVSIAFVEPDKVGEVALKSNSENACIPETLKSFEADIECGYPKCAQSQDLRKSTCSDGVAFEQTATGYTSDLVADSQRSLTREPKLVISSCVSEWTLSLSDAVEDCSSPLSCEDCVRGAYGECSLLGVGTVSGRSCFVSCDRVEPLTSLAVRLEGACIASDTDPCKNGTRAVTFEPCTRRQEGCAPHPTRSTDYTESCSLSTTACHPQPIQVIGGIYASDGCSSSVFDIRGSCCEPGTVGLDACGLCPNTMYPDVGSIRIGLDAEGACCSSTLDAGGVSSSPVLTGGLVCCPSAARLDVCGVCDGDGGSCSLTIPVPPRTAPSALPGIERSLGEAVQRKVSVKDGAFAIAPGEPLTGDHLAAAFLSATQSIKTATTRRHLSDRGDGIDSGVITVYPIGTHGNGVCEIGETYLETDDCFDIARMCDVPGPGRTGRFVGNPTKECGGRGACSRATLTCHCPPGYMGRACEDCAAGFSALPISNVGESACLPTDTSSLVEAFLANPTDPTPIIAFGGVVAIAALVAFLRARFRRVRCLSGGDGDGEGEGEGDPATQ